MGQVKTVSHIEYSHSWEGRHGERHDFEIEFEDGTKGTVTGQKQEHWASPGDKVIVEDTGREHNGIPKLSIKKEGQQGGGYQGSSSSGSAKKTWVPADEWEREFAKIPSMSVSYALRHIETNKPPEGSLDKKPGSDEVVALAKKYQTHIIGQMVELRDFYKGLKG